MEPCSAELRDSINCFVADLGNATSGPLFRSPNGAVFEQLWQWYPELEPFYFDFEKVFNPRDTVLFSQHNLWLAFAICAAYCFAVELGRHWMKDRKPYQLDGPLFWWNVLLAVFSIIGSIKTVPHLLHNLFVLGPEFAICAPAEASYGCGATGFWTCLFIFSKIPELGDTVFLVLRKKPVIFLHWYHHVSVLLYSWWSYATMSSAGLWFIAVNFTVHAVMYSYYALRARGIKLKAVAPVITTLQISQMVLGAFICASVPYLTSQGVDCAMTAEAYWGGIAIFASYFYLFSVLAIARYCSSGGKSEEVRTPKAARQDDEPDASDEPEARTIPRASTPTHSTSHTRRRGRRRDN